MQKECDKSEKDQYRILWGYLYHTSSHKNPPIKHYKNSINHNLISHIFNELTFNRNITWSRAPPLITNPTSRKTKPIPYEKRTSSALEALYFFRESSWKFPAKETFIADTLGKDKMVKFGKILQSFMISSTFQIHLRLKISDSYDGLILTMYVI